MRDRWNMSILGLILILAGTAVTAFVTINYRGDADEKREEIERISKENKKLNQSIDSISARNEKLNKTIDSTTTLNQRLINENIELTNSANKVIKSNLALTEKIDILSNEILKKAKKIEYPVEQEYLAFMNFEIQVSEANKDIEEFNKIISSEQDLFKKKELLYKSELTNELRILFSEASFVFMFWEMDAFWFSLDSHYNLFRFDRNKMRTFSPKISAQILYRGRNKFEVIVQYFPLKISSNLDYVSSMLDLKDKPFYLDFRPKYKIDNSKYSVKFTRLELQAGQRELFEFMDFTYTKDGHVPKVVNFKLKDK